MLRFSPIQLRLRMKRYFLLLPLALLCCVNIALANDGAAGHKIRVRLENYPEKQLVLGFYYGEKPYVKDTAELAADGYFHFDADTLLPCGVYLLVTKPDNGFIQFLMPADDQDFTLTTDAKLAVDKMSVKGSDENTTFYQYLQLLNRLRPEADTLRAQLSRAKGRAADSTRLATKIGEIDKQVKKYQHDLIAKYPGTLAAKIVNASLEPEPPAYQGDEKEVNRRKYYWFREHYFDHVDITDACMLRSPVLHPKIEQYVTKFVPQHPDSISLAIDYLLGKVRNTPEIYKYYVIHFLNYYAKSNIVGMDAVYVHIAENYYCNGKAAWTEKDQLEKICDNAARLKPILIGKIAPNIQVLDRNNQPSSLWDVDADYTVLFFWDPECGHCKKSAPHMVEFANKFKDRGVKIFAVCTAITDKAGDCWKSIEEKGFTDFLFLNRYDPYIKSRYKTLYDVRTTPQIFILDRKHEILMKRIGAEQLSQVMEEVMKFQEEKKKQGK
jgi:thiol-disulfide isomerase/thioredoxin